MKMTPHMILKEIIKNIQEPKKDEIEIKIEEMLDYDYEQLRYMFTKLAVKHNSSMLSYENSGFRILADKFSAKGNPSITILFDLTFNGMARTFADDIMFKDGLAKFSPYEIFLKMVHVVNMYVGEIENE